MLVTAKATESQSEDVIDNLSLWTHAQDPKKRTTVPPDKSVLTSVHC